jgi:hypothetical protein
LLSDDHIKEDVTGSVVEIQNSVNIFVGKPEGKILFWISGSRYKNIKQQKLRK